MQTGPGVVPLLPRAEAIIAFIEHYGFQPRQQHIDWFGKRHGIQLMARRKDPHAPALALVRARFHATGRWLPPLLPRGVEPIGGWHDLADGAPELVALARAYPRKRAPSEPWTITEIEAVIARAFDVLGPGERLTAQRYKQLPRADGYPSGFTIAKHAKAHGTSFGQMVRDEAARRAQRAPA